MTDKKMQPFPSTRVFSADFLAILALISILTLVFLSFFLNRDKVDKVSTSQDLGLFAG